MTIDLTRIPAAGWTSTALPEFPCCPDPQLDALAKAGAKAATVAGLDPFLQDAYASTLYAFGQVLRDHLPAQDLQIAAADMADLYHGDAQAIVHHGNLTVDGDFAPPSVLVVTGNLQVNGIMHDSANMAVLGDVHAQHLYTQGWFIVGGDCVVEGFVHGEYNDNMFEGLGRLKAHAVIVDEHAFHAESGFAITLQPAEAGISWERELFDLREEKHRAELLADVAPAVHAVLPLERFAAFEE